jgi:hypothetical protein
MAILYTGQFWIRKRAFEIGSKPGPIAEGESREALILLNSAQVVEAIRYGRPLRTG